MGAPVVLHPHAKERAAERGATVNEVVATIRQGESFPARLGRTGFRRNFPFDGLWRGRRYANKQIEAYAIEANGRWIVITVLVKFF
jgi:Domain of unknown function (DUF4258)